jgi:hypothetical protein
MQALPRHAVVLVATFARKHQVRYHDHRDNFRCNLRAMAQKNFVNTNSTSAMAMWKQKMTLLAQKTFGRQRCPPKTMLTRHRCVVADWMMLLC